MRYSHYKWMETEGEEGNEDFQEILQVYEKVCRQGELRC